MKIAVAMSGGIDSSTAALILMSEGHEVIGINARLLDGLRGTPDTIRGAMEKSLGDATSIAHAFGFPMHSYDLVALFEESVVNPFCDDYLAGRTPNPCVRCNAAIKFGRLWDIARELGCEAIATGHYARIGQTPEGRHYVLAGADPARDQSYFLFHLDQDVLHHVVFPLGGITKDEVRTRARSFGLQTAEKPDSQDICFIPDNDYPAFIERHTGHVPAPGDIVDRQGKILGTHGGIHRYTIGQRRGLGIAAERPLHVLSIDARLNRVEVGFREELSVTSLVAGGVARMKAEHLHGIRCLVKCRSTHIAAEAHLEEITEGGVTVIFSAPQFGISPGQSCVFYDNDLSVLGGGTIISSQGG